MRTKSAYRGKPAEKIPEPQIPEIKIDGQEPAAIAGVSAELPHEVEPEDAAVAAMEAATNADASKYALLAQLEQIRNA